VDAEDLKNYEARAKVRRGAVFRRTRSKGQHVNGKLVLGESIADLGGLGSPTAPTAPLSPESRSRRRSTG
jgi:predicted metalloendopeptidase